MGITIKEIAALSGVGISTVSRVINNTGSASAATKKKVLDVVQQYGYVPNSNAKYLKTSQSNNIGLLVKGMGSSFFQKMIHEMEHNIALRGYHLHLHSVDGFTDELDAAIRLAQERSLCGVILMGGSYEYSQERMSRLKIPCVLLTISARESVDKALYGSVTINDELEGFRAVEHLISLGHRRIGFIYYDPKGQKTPNSLRYQGYQRALREYGIPFDPNLVSTSSSVGLGGMKMGFLCFKQLYAKNPDMTAIFSYADEMAAGAAKGALSMGLSIPGDISILGFDGIDMTEYYHPAIDTIYQPSTEMALSSVDILFDMINGNPSQHIIYDCMLLKRGSCASLK